MPCQPSRQMRLALQLQGNEGLHHISPGCGAVYSIQAHRQAAHPPALKACFLQSPRAGLPHQSALPAKSQYKPLPSLLHPHDGTGLTSLHKHVSSDRPWQSQQVEGFTSLIHKDSRILLSV